MIKDIGDANEQLVNISDTAKATLLKIQTALQKLSATMSGAADSFDHLHQALAKAIDTGDSSELEKITGTDPDLLASSLAQPIKLDRTAVFPVVSFGVGMAPLYMVISLWVGALLMTVAIKTGVGHHTTLDGPELTATKKYLGRYGIFAATGLAQSTLAGLGLVYFVEIKPVHSMLFLLAGWVASLVFTLIMYTMTVAFGNAGKALAVLLLVIQISGAGGAYPLQMLPHWFQSVSPLLPATYAINAMRAAIAGTYHNDYWISVGLLALFVIPTLFLGLVLRRPLISSNRNFVNALESTKLM